MSVCPRCGGKTAPTRTRDSRRVAGLTFVVEVPSRTCKSCREVFVPSVVLERLELTIAGDLAMNGPLTGESFRFMRKALGIAAMHLAGLLDVAPETLSRWEHGQRAVDSNAWLTLGSVVLERLRRRTDTLRRLEALPTLRRRRSSKPVRLVLAKSLKAD